MKSIAVDLGGTNIKLGIVENGKVLFTNSIAALSEKGLKPQLVRLVEELKKILKANNLDLKDFNGIAFSAPGIVDYKQKIILSINEKYADATTIDFPKWAHDTLGLKTALENDARSALLGEWRYGAAKGTDNVVGVTLGTGIGSSAIIEGKVLRGTHYLAGIMGGHLTINYNGEKCNCGNLGCVEREASSWALKDLLAREKSLVESSLSKFEKVDFKIIFEEALTGDKTAKKIRDHCLRVWGLAIINLIHAYDPELVVINGGLMKSKDIIIPFIQELVSRYAWTPWGKVKVIAAEHLDTAALLGASYLLEE